MSITETPRAAPLHLWREVETLLHQLFTLFGEPQQIAFQHTLTAKSHKLLARWLRGAEALLRQLLLLEAFHLGPPASSRQSATRRAAAPRQKRLLEFWPDKPEAWRVTFRVLVSSGALAKAGARAKACGRAPQSTQKRFFSAWPLAERAEALLRVFNNPLPYARRLARKLHAHARLPRLEASHHHGVLPEELVEAINAHVDATRAPPNSS